MVEYFCKRERPIAGKRRKKKQAEEADLVAVENMWLQSGSLNLTIPSQSKVK